MNSPQAVQIQLTPFPPDNASSIRAELIPLVETALAQRGHTGLLENGQIRIDVEETFPTAEVIDAVIMFGSAAALEVFKEIVLPILRQRFGVRIRDRGQDHLPEA